MGRHEKHKERMMEELIAEYVQMNGGAGDTSGAMEYVEAKIGLRPSKGMVIGVFEMLGLQWQEGRWIRGV